MEHPACELEASQASPCKALKQKDPSRCKGKQTSGDTRKELQTTVTYHALSENHHKIKPFQEQWACPEPPKTSQLGPTQKPCHRRPPPGPGPTQVSPSLPTRDTAPHGDPCPPTETSPHPGRPRAAAPVPVPPFLSPGRRGWRGGGRQSTAEAAGEGCPAAARAHRLRPVEPGAAQGVGGGPGGGRQCPAQRSHSARQRPARLPLLPPHRASPPPPPLPALCRRAAGACAVRRGAPPSPLSPSAPFRCARPRRRPLAAGREHCSAGPCAAWGRHAWGAASEPRVGRRPAGPPRRAFLPGQNPA